MDGLGSSARHTYLEVAVVLGIRVVVPTPLGVHGVEGQHGVEAGGGCGGGCSGGCGVVVRCGQAGTGLGLEAGYR